MAKKKPNKVYDLIIIGGGPAAVTAGIYAARKKLDLILLTQKFGGDQLAYTSSINNYPGIKNISSGAEFVSLLREQAKEYKLDIIEGETVAKLSKKGDNFLVKTKKDKEYESRSVIVASGKTPRKLGVPGGEDFESKGVSYCSICDAPLFQDKDVVVVGGGNAGLDSARDLAKYANKIYVLEFGPRIIGDMATQEELKKRGKVEFIVMAQAKEIKGDKFVKALLYEDRNTKEKKELKIQGVFVNVGNVTSTDFIKGFLELNPVKEIIINHKTNQTSIEGVFAAGDCTDVSFKQIIIACGEGAKAALSVNKYLTQNK
ncbi:MAG TPA: FAD-dependent oxidoreductase [Candidatus Parcubacteria bacterium]|mgnify:CR=1 FL=1|jgi:alkyl hydroperoxide reductase subunit F|nr:pyridine nucleotide-disulfide oxidoreductase [Parcubacteria group bacterium]HJN62125.1 FAD-dependent oxidoreductase [Candidatus Parcubacteria bacterium]|tara:strand:- start:20561 stop:21508 length:948 start_codon:yes stop_codon:yes gene_type:complete